LKSALIGTAVVAGILTPFVQQQSITALRRENAALLQKNADLARRVDRPVPTAPEDNQEEVDRLRKDKMELSRLRAEVASLRRTTNELRQSASARRAEAQPASGNSGTYLPESSWVNAGMGTAESSFQTLLSSLKGGDPQQVAGLIQWQAQGGDPNSEQFKKLMNDVVQGMLKSAGKLEGLRIVDSQEMAEDRMRLNFESVTKEGKSIPGALQFRRVNDEWRLELPITHFQGPTGEYAATPSVFGPEIDLDSPNVGLKPAN
jgi:hypothetical protein